MAVEVLWIRAGKPVFLHRFWSIRRRWIGCAISECAKRAESLTCAHLWCAPRARATSGDTKCVRQRDL
jgi:hypothetical protein